MRIKDYYQLGDFLDCLIKVKGRPFDLELYVSDVCNIFQKDLSKLNKNLEECEVCIVNKSWADLNGNRRKQTEICLRCLNYSALCVSKAILWWD